MKYIDEINYDTEITSQSPFPEWIETNKIYLKKLTEETVSPQKLRKLRKDNHGYEQYFTTNTQFKTTYSSILDWYDKADKLWEQRTDAFYAMFIPKTDEFIGLGFLEEVDFSLQKAKSGIWLDESYRGQNLAQAKLEALLIISFEHLKFDVIEFEIVTENKISIKAIEKCMSAFGGSFDGRLRNETHTPNDGIHDTYRWSISKEEFYDSNSTYTYTIQP